MRNIPLESTPNQSLTVNLDGRRWLLRIKECRGVMACDVSLDDVPILQGIRICPGTPIIPYEHLQGNGNFLLLVDREELADWRQFGMSQSLIYVSPGEI